VATGNIAAFFDMDLTVIAVNSGSEWVKHLRKKGELTRWGMLKAMSWIARYKLALIDLHNSPSSWSPIRRQGRGQPAHRVRGLGRASP